VTTAVCPSAPVTNAADGTTNPATVGTVTIFELSSACPVTGTWPH